MTASAKSTQRAVWRQRPERITGEDEVIWQVRPVQKRFRRRTVFICQL
ncbi:hypothetical protein HCU64_06505 [Methylobacterium sp. C25]|nr:hypothetical protein [Methylobacterium sp. C25]MCE4223397.1 hypothetical protein [Methylobacterium sp. C25]